MAAIRDEAEALAEALFDGLCDVAEVVAWADCWLIREDAPSLALCEVSLARDRPSIDVAGLLRDCPGTWDASTVRRLFLILLQDRFQSLALSAERVAKILDLLASSDEIEDPELCDVGRWAWDELVGDPPYYNTPHAEVVARMGGVLARVVAEAGVAWSAGMTLR